MWSCENIKWSNTKIQELRDLALFTLIYENVVQILCYNEHNQGIYRRLNSKLVIH